MNKRTVILGTCHQLQGLEGYSKNIDDQSYRDLVEQLIFKEAVDFIFEEAAGRGASHAKQLADSHLGLNHYLDVDLNPDARQKHGLSPNTVKTYPIDEDNSTGPHDFAHWVIVKEQSEREKLWLQRIVDQDFSSGLVVCGLPHSLSFAFRLMTAGFDVEKCFNYMPHHKLC